MGALTSFTSGNVRVHSQQRGALASSRPSPALTMVQTGAAQWTLAWLWLGLPDLILCRAQAGTAERRSAGFGVVPPLQCPWETCSYNGSCQDLQTRHNGRMVRAWSSGLESACGHWGCVLELRVKLSARAVERCAVWPCWGCEVGVPQPLLSAALWPFLLHASYTACAEGSTRAGEATGFACRQKTFSSWKR